MNIDSGYPSPIDLIKNELRVLNFLRSQSIIEENFYELSRAAQFGFDKYKIDQKSRNANFKFESGLDLEINKRWLHFHFGAIIISYLKGRERKVNIYEYDRVTHFCAICLKEEDTRLKLIRKFHFDYQKPKKTQTQHFPFFHIQYPGELTPGLKEMELIDDHLYPWLSEPRIQFNPMTLTLILNLIFCEFQNEITFKITQLNEWFGIVKECEDLVLKQYYNNCFEFINSRQNRSKLFTSDFCYGK